MAAILGACFLLLLIPSCGASRQDTWDGDKEIELCKPHRNDCEGGMIGERCKIGDDCADGVCCLTKDCGGKTCTFLCGSNADCAPGMLCEGGFCFFSCTADADCNSGQKCDHDHTICQYD